MKFLLTWIAVAEVVVTIRQIRVPVELLIEVVIAAAHVGQERCRRVGQEDLHGVGGEIAASMESCVSKYKKCISTASGAVR